MNKKENVSLASLTSFKCGGDASYVVYCKDIVELSQAISFAKEKELPWYVLGEGTNVLARDAGFAGVIIRPVISGITYVEEGTTTYVTAGAGESWDALVQSVAEKGLWDIENLAGIPGTVGASPVQNIGAYGVELCDTFVHAEVFNTHTATQERVEKDTCAFGYRDSMFKRNKHLIILSVTLALSSSATPKLSYKDLAHAKDEGVPLSTVQEIGDAVRTIRSRKFPDLAVHGTAGSFFKNPIITQAEFASLTAAYGEIPHYVQGGGIKIPLAYVLDTILQLRGYSQGHARLFEAQPLVLVLDAGGTSSEVETLARFVEARVKEKIHIVIEREVQTL